MPKKLSYFLFFFFFNFVFVSIANSPVRGAISTCTASISPSTMTTSSSQDFTFTINNTSETTAIWIKVTRPASDYTLTGYTGTGWGQSFSDESVTLTGGTLAASGSLSFVLGIDSGSSESSSASWTVQLSDDAGGASATTCSGSLSTSITNAPVISNLAVSEVSDTSAKITWTTDKNTNAVVNYGTTTAYGSSKSDSTQTTSHSITLTSLSAKTTYHYQVQSTDSSSQTTQSSDNTFATSTAATTTTVTTTVTVTPTPTPVDITGPGIVLTTNFSKSFQRAPMIAGTVTDTTGVSKLEYSTDNGRTWLPVDKILTPGAKSTSFEFTPNLFIDGDYKIKVRATDVNGYTSYSKSATLVIDRLPPAVGGSLISLGPQILMPNFSGIILTLTGLDQKITLSSVGGPTTIDLAIGKQMFSLIRSIGSNLWTGTIGFQKPGLYSLEARSLDGAKNKTQRKLNRFYVLPAGKVTSGGASLEGSLITVYLFDEESQKFVLWDAKPFNQDNPQKTDSNGSYRLFLPAGKYYLEIKAMGLQTLQTNIFKITKSSPINQNFTLEKSKFLTFFNIPKAVFIKPEGQIPQEKIQPSRLIGQEFPDFNFSSDLGSINNNFLWGKKTVICFLNTWLTQTTEQITILETLVQEEKANILVIVPQETKASVFLFKNRAAYQLPIVADSDGELVTPLDLQSLPTFFFLDKNALIKKITTGVLKKEEILFNLANL